MESKNRTNITEGDSAKTLAVSGLSQIGRDHFGVFPSRGKLFNAQEASNKQIAENQKIVALSITSSTMMLQVFDIS